MNDKWVVVLFFDDSGIDLQDVIFLEIPKRYQGDAFHYGWEWGHNHIGKKVDFSKPCVVRCFHSGYSSGNNWYDWMEYSKNYSNACLSDDPTKEIIELHRDV